MGTNHPDSSFTHPSRHLLARYAEGRLNDEMMDCIGKHVLSCQDCTKTLLEFNINLDQTLVTVECGESVLYDENIDLLVKLPGNEHLPKTIGRYRVEDLLGRGGFGDVYLAVDDKLNRRVAIKVPHSKNAILIDPAKVSQAEAKVTAKLEHAQIVPVYDIGSDPEHQFYIVSKYIEGCDLSTLARAGIERETALNILISIAEVLQFAHDRGVIHRDVKPSNILLDADGQVYLTDFGLALQADVAEEIAIVAGTAAYMSPEQARGEGHRVDGRSDLFSLAVTMYELLTRQRPFKGKTKHEILEQTAYANPIPLCQLDATIPKPLERICLKALAKSATQRYNSCAEFADELRSYLDESSVEFATTNGAHSSLIVIPKGVRSFDRDDAEFFMGLLPGPKNRSGFPESISFWKNVFESREADHSKSVCLLYGPSGSGKSSFIKAGVLPTLTQDVLPVIMEASPEGFELRLLEAIHDAVPEVADTQSLTEACRAIREHHDESAPKIVLVLDQFEQWLSAQSEFEKAELTSSLRQCDGSRLQAVLVVRDEFWMSASRLMQALDIEIHNRSNASLLDLFSKEHARRVLAGFGAYFECLPSNLQDLTAEQQQFLSDSVDWLAEAGQVVPIQLVMFAEMMRHREWSSAGLADSGGFENLGVSYLDEKLTGPHAPQVLKANTAAVRVVLKKMLPVEPSDLKQHGVTESELRDAVNVSDTTLREIVRALSEDLNLITLAHASSSNISQKSYQLGHDALVPSVREWLARYERTTLKGRSYLLLSSLAESWKSNRDVRQLPTLLEFLQIQSVTKACNRTSRQKDFLSHARKYYGLRTVIVLAALILAVVAAIQFDHARESKRMVLALQSAGIEQVPRLIRDMNAHWNWVQPQLLAVHQKADDGSTERIHTSLALLKHDDRYRNEVYDFAVNSQTPEEVQAVLRCLRIAGIDSPKQLWEVLQDPNANDPCRLRAASILAQTNPNDDRWDTVNADIVYWLMQENSLQWKSWVNLLTPIADHLSPHLASEIIQTHDHRVCETLAEVYSNLADGEDSAFTPLVDVINEDSEIASPEQASQRAAAVFALAVANRWTLVWPNLKHAPDPTARTELIERLKNSQIPARRFLDQLRNIRERDASVKFALALILAEKADSRSIERGGEALIEEICVLYDNTTDQGLRSALEWMARQGAWKSRLELNHRSTTTSPIMVTIETGVQDAVDYKFSVGVCEITVEDFLKFRPDHDFDRRSAPNDQCPVNNVTWYDAAAYCNWLSQQDDIPETEWCFKPNANGEYASGMSIRGNYSELAGYRLPTVDEWLATARSGSTTQWSIGNSPEFLTECAWFLDNSGFRTHSVAQQRPNDFGAFDMHGNAWEWTLGEAEEQQGNQRSLTSDLNQDIIVRDGDIRRLCGGTYLNDAQTLRFEFENWNSVSHFTGADGFRVARTVIEKSK
ncbi:protein kinase [Thalassoglobus sp. JC818]|uniref:protein kinase domain-containing protein n=1 Tax=Thalassoglobus sp. JC818 TaxID=3232136 RepID=UPI003459FA1C